MPNPSIRIAVYNLLAGNPTLLALLGNGVNSIVSTQRLGQGFASSVVLPAIVLQELESPGTPRTYPFSETRFNVDVYDENRGQNTNNYFRIDAILKEAVETLHKVTITTQMSYSQVFEILYENYRSRDLWDYYLTLPHKYERFCVYSADYRYDSKNYV